MAIITKIRNRAGLSIGLIALALLAFLATDLLSGSSKLFGNKDVVGEIAGEEIEYPDFQNKVEELKVRYAQSLGRQPNESEMPFVRREAWNEMVYGQAFQKDFEKLGIRITPEELVDMIQGNNIEPRFAQRFFNPETGEIDRNQIVGYIKTLQSNPQQYYQQYVDFILFEQSLKTTRPRDKYTKLFELSTYVTKAEAKREYEDANTNLTLEYAFVPYTVIPNEEAKPSEAQLKAYYDEHKKDFDRKAQVSLEYVAFPLNASSSDSALLRQELEALATQFAQVPFEEDTTFVASNSDTRNNFNAYFPSELPDELVNEQYEKGKVVGPLLKDNTYILYKMNGIIENAKPHVKARHILFEVRQGTSEEDKAKIKADAQDILKRLQEGADFGFMANQYSADKSNNSKGGDLGWFTEGAMVKPFNDAVMNATTTGLIPRLIETDFGFHIIRVDATKTSSQYGVATIVRKIIASEKTREGAYQLAGDFAQCQQATEYVDKVKENNKISLQALSIEQTDNNINNLTGNGVREIIRWAFNEETSLGSVSEVFELEDQYIVAMLSERQTEGIAPLEKVRQEILPKVRNELKAKMIIEKINGKKIDQVQSIYPKAIVETSDNVNFKNTMLRGVGGVSSIIGKAFTMKKGEVSAPFEEGAGIIIIKVEDKTDPVVVEDFDTYGTRLAMPRSAQMEVQLLRAIKKVAEVKDNTAKYF